MPVPLGEGPRFYQRPAGPDLVGGVGQERVVREHVATGSRVIHGAGTVDTARLIGAYAERFQGSRTGYQERIFSHGTTPLLEVVNNVAPKGVNGSRTIMEVGAGGGLHSALLAREPLSRVIAVEPNAAKTGIHDLLATHTPGLQSEVHVVPADMFAVLGGLGRLANGSADTVTIPRNDDMFSLVLKMGTPVDVQPDAVTICRPNTIYSSSVAHLLDEAGRRDLWAVSAAALPVGGILAASLKGEGDAQQHRAEVVGKGPEGVYGKDPQYPAITRLFVSDPRAIMQEMGVYGLKPAFAPMTWSTTGYDFPGEDAQHVGFVMQKVA